MKRYGSYFHEVSANNIQTCFHIRAHRWTAIRAVIG